MGILKINYWRDLPENYTGIVEYKDGPIYYCYLNGKLHREDGPAIIHPDGALEYYLNGLRHREDGPAAIWRDGTVYWYVNGNNIAKEVNNWIIKNLIHNYKVWNKADKRLFRKTFCYSAIELERLVKHQSESSKLLYFLKLIVIFGLIMVDFYMIFYYI